MKKENYKVINPFGNTNSKGTWDDIFQQNIYSSLQDAHNNNDYVHGDYVIDEAGTMHIQLHHSKNPEQKKLYTLNFQRPVVGIDALDDNNAFELAISFFESNNK